MKPFIVLLLALVAVVVGASTFIGLGAYNVAADDPHWPMTYRLMETVRGRSISTRAVDIAVPPLDDGALIRAGAGNYDAMCVGCHLSPGAPNTELSLGLYPPPPTWSELGAVDPREAFWVIKHGVKMSGMPAWGKSMDDRYIWGMVALLQQFPRMTKARYYQLVSTSGGHDHGGGESMPHNPATIPGMGGMDPASDAATGSSIELIDDPMTEAASGAAGEGPKPAHDHRHEH